MRMASEDRRRQLPWVVLGLTVTLTSAVIFALWATSLSSRTTVMVADRDIPAGSSVEIGDLRAVDVASGQGADFVPIADLDSVVGRTVRATVPEGAILHPALLTTGSPLDQDMALVGVVLHPGEYPIAHLSPGQSVGVVFTGEDQDVNALDNTNQRKGASSSAIAASTTKAAVAEVSEVLESGQEAFFVSLLTAADDAVLISKAAASGDMRLILLPEESRSGDNPAMNEPFEEAVR